MGLIKVCPWNFSGSGLKPAEIVRMKIYSKQINSIILRGFCSSQFLLCNITCLIRYSLKFTSQPKYLGWLFGISICRWQWIIILCILLSLWNCLFDCHLHFKVFSDSTIINTFFIKKFEIFAHKILIAGSLTGKV